MENTAITSITANIAHCPFEELGILFKHEISMRYSFQKSCKNKLCQFQHDVTDEINDILKMTKLILMKI